MYDEAVKVPLIFSWPGPVSENVQDTTSLVSGLDIVPTRCDFVCVKAPPDMRGRTLRAVLEGRAATGAEFVAAEMNITGGMVRTPDFKRDLGVIDLVTTAATVPTCRDQDPNSLVRHNPHGLHACQNGL